jgi:hypothetical protein
MWWRLQPEPIGDRNGGEDELVRGDKDRSWVGGEAHSSCRDGVNTEVDDRLATPWAYL